MKLFAVYPGPVVSKNDWDHHYIGARELMLLYEVDPRECVVVDYDRPSTFEGLSQEFIDSLMSLRVMTGVDYSPVRPAERERLIERLSCA